MSPENLHSLAQRPLIVPPAPAATIIGKAIMMHAASYKPLNLNVGMKNKMISIKEHTGKAMGRCINLPQRNNSKPAKKGYIILITAIQKVE